MTEPESCAPCEPGAIGEIRVRGRNVMRGICGRTRETVFDADGFYATKDLGALDADGFLWYHGRLDDMFKVSGATVYPIEVEAALRTIDGVHQAHVTNLPGPGDTQEVGALVVTSRTLDELMPEIRSRLSAFKVPTRWRLTDRANDLPLTATGKADLALLRGLLQASDIEADAGTAP